MTNKTLRQAVNTPAISKNFGIAVVLSLVAAMFWAYWPVLVSLFKEWQSDDNYSVCQLVPLVAIYLIWRDKAALRELGASPCWWGLGLIVLALAARAYGLLFLFESAERYSFVLVIAGLVMLVVGWRMFRRVFWILMYLFLMAPLPGRIHNMISGPMQNMATTGSVFLLEVFGVTVSQEGNTILLNGSIPLAVAEACSGLRMLTAFIVVAGAMAFLVNRPVWQKATLVLSSIPIAIGCNLARLCVTAMLYLVADSETAERFFHDFAGLTMMPIAVFVLFGELWLMNKLIIPDDAPASDATSGHGRKGGETA
jgi:exosortase